jgi:hypothetical protein
MIMNRRVWMKKTGVSALALLFARYIKATDIIMPHKFGDFVKADFGPDFK